MTDVSLADHKAHEHKISKLQEFLKQIIYGGNDGIVTTFAIVAGFAGAGAEGAAQIGGIAVLLFGVANLLADATAMGLGEFLSARSEQDVYRATRDKELYEIKHVALESHERDSVPLRWRDGSGGWNLCNRSICGWIGLRRITAIPTVSISSTHCLLLSRLKLCRI